MPNPPVQRESDKIEEELRQLILSLELEPGTAASEAMLISHYGWGRTPLREAFQRLAEQELLQIVPHHGVVITPLSVFDFVEVMDAMSLVIGPAAALACQRMSAGELAGLDGLIEQAEAAASQPDLPRLAELDYQFHSTLANATGNRYLSGYLLRLHRAAERFNLAAWQRDRLTQPSLAEHRQIVAALQLRDPSAAEAAMRAHIEHARNRVLGKLS
jgi:DNA-binding GntR family transcriptional regulator